MRIIVSIEDLMIEIDDEQPHPTLEGIESVLKRVVSAAIDLYENTRESITFVSDADTDDDEVDE
jgi:hypothetical protein